MQRATDEQTNTAAAAATTTMNTVAARRWEQTPAAMQMPVRVRARPQQPEWTVNRDPKALDRMYDRFLGSRWEGHKMLPEEIKVGKMSHSFFDDGAGV